MTADAASPPLCRREVLGVLAVTVAVRALYLAFYRASPFFAAPILDSAYHADLAHALAAGDWSAGAPYFRPPLFPWPVSYTHLTLPTN